MMALNGKHYRYGRSDNVYIVLPARSESSKLNKNLIGYLDHKLYI